MTSTSRDLETATRAFRSGEFWLCETLLARILERDPGNSRANELLAYIEGNRGNLERTLVLLQQATSSKDASPEAWYSLGKWFMTAGDPARAVPAFQKALDARASFFECLHDLGVAHFALGDASQAEAALSRAVRIRPDSFEGHHNLGRARQALRRFEDALSSYMRALARNGRSAETWLNRGETLASLRRYGDALASYSKAVELDPQLEDACFNEALTLLVLGRLAEGFAKYEYRWKGKMPWPRRHTELPAWLGESPIHGKRLLVWWEQGFGDTLHFCRYVPMLAAQGVDIVFEVQRALKPLLTSLPGATVIAEGDPFPPCDLQIPLLSLPLVFRTTLGTIPGKVPYLRADASKAASWRTRLGTTRDRPRIAIACWGHASQKDNAQRSISLPQLQPLAGVGDLFLVAPDIDDENQRCAEALGITCLGREIHDFSDTAAIVQNMDLVVTIDTSLAHLAGAMGRPVWILLPWTPTWRWLVDRGDTPWYPTARLFRQHRVGDWDSSIGDVLKALSESELLVG